MHGNLNNFHKTNDVYSSVNRLLKSRWGSSSLQWVAVWKLIQYCCALTCRDDACDKWFAMTLVYSNIQIAP